MITTSQCSVSAGKTITCTETVKETATCAPGIICQVDGKGNDVCMRRDNHLTTGGLIVTISFAFGIVGAILAVIVSHYQSNAANRKVEAERAALLGDGAFAATGNGKGRAASAAPTYQQHNPSEAVIPLMTPGGSRSDEVYQHPYNNDNDYYQASGAAGSNPGPAGGHSGAPKLHPGLGALGQDYP